MEGEGKESEAAWVGRDACDGVDFRAVLLNGRGRGEMK